MQHISKIIKPVMLTLEQKAQQLLKICDAYHEKERIVKINIKNKKSKEMIEKFLKALLSRPLKNSRNI